MTMVVTPAREAAPARGELDVDAVRALALEDALGAHVTPLQRAAFAAWVAMLAIAVAFLAAVAASAALDAVGAAF